MAYIFDTSSFIVLSHYFPTRFPSFWGRFNNCVSDGRIVSVREVFKELDGHATKPHLREWMDANKNIFLIPSPQETEFVREILADPRFQALIKLRKILTGGPAADPFVIASAKVRDACVITEETKQDNVVKIPTVCEHYRIDYMSLEGLMEREGWRF